MDLPGSSAFGVFNVAMFRTMVSLLKAWLEKGPGDGEKEKKGRGKKAKGRSRRGNNDDSESDEEQEESEGEEDVEGEENEPDQRQGDGRRRLRARRAPTRRTTTKSSSFTAGPMPILAALRSCLIQSSLANSLEGHEDLLADMIDMVVGLLCSSPNGSGLAGTSREILLGSLGGGALDRHSSSTTMRTVALRALMPLLIMKPSHKPGMPADARQRTAAHQKALEVRNVCGSRSAFDDY